MVNIQEQVRIDRAVVSQCSWRNCKAVWRWICALHDVRGWGVALDDVRSQGSDPEEIKTITREALMQWQSSSIEVVVMVAKCSTIHVHE